MILIFTKELQINSFFVILLIILSLFGISSFFIILKLKYKNYLEVKEKELDFTKKTKSLLREQRHDYMNLFQITYGYLQLNKRDKAIEYINKAISTLSNHSKCYYLTVFSMSVLLEKKVKIGESKGIEVVIDVDSFVDNEVRNIENESTILERISMLFDIFIDCTYRANRETKLFVDIYEHTNRIEIVFNGDIDENLINKKYKTINNIVQKDDSYIVEVYFDKMKNPLCDDASFSVSNSY